MENKWVYFSLTYFIKISTSRIHPNRNWNIGYIGTRNIYVFCSAIIPINYERVVRVYTSLKPEMSRKRERLLPYRFAMHAHITGMEPK